MAEPPPAPASTVAMPSAASARPVSGSTSVPVICPTDFTWPMFSATRAITAGRNIGSTARSKDGAWNSGSPIQAAAAIAEIGQRLATDPTLQARVDGWVTDAAVFLVDRYRHDIASIITDTVEKWDPAETTEKIELMVGRDLQYIRLNGTIVGALAGAAIYAIAHALIR